MRSLLGHNTLQLRFEVTPNALRYLFLLQLGLGNLERRLVRERNLRLCQGRLRLFGHDWYRGVLAQLRARLLVTRAARRFLVEARLSGRHNVTDGGSDTSDETTINSKRAAHRIPKLLAKQTLIDETEPLVDFPAALCKPENPIRLHNAIVTARRARVFLEQICNLRHNVMLDHLDEGRHEHLEQALPDIFRG